MGSRQFSWQDSAACKGVPSYIFFTDEERPNEDSPLFDARYAGKTYEEYCNRCPVMWKCREFAELHDLQGYWGNLSEKERNASSSSYDRKNLREIKEEYGEYSPLYGHS